MIGRVTAGERAIVGWYFDPNRPEAYEVELYCGDILLRRINCRNDWPNPPTKLAVPRACGFSLQIRNGLRRLLPAGIPLEVRTTDGTVLPCRAEPCIYGTAADDGKALRRFLSQGWVIDKWGSMKLPFHARPGLDQEFFDFYAEVSSRLQDRMGLRLYLAYGSLLGCIREKGVIPHDDDIDAAYLSEHQDVASVAWEFHSHLAAIRTVLADDKITVRRVDTGQMSLIRKGLHFDIFASWVDPAQRYNCYFGVGGDCGAEPFGLQQIAFMGHDLWIPENPERVLEWTYGPGWKVPDPGFQWRASPAVRTIMDSLREAGAKASAPPVPG